MHIFECTHAQQHPALTNPMNGCWGFWGSWFQSSWNSLEKDFWLKGNAHDKKHQQTPGWKGCVPDLLSSPLWSSMILEPCPVKPFTSLALDFNFKWIVNCFRHCCFQASALWTILSRAARSLHFRCCLHSHWPIFSSSISYCFTPSSPVAVVTKWWVFVEPVTPPAP